MIYIVIGYLWVSLLLYLMMGGADFGAGILELFTSEHNKSDIRKISYKAIGPIWEANHMWLIIAVVILFVGFPGVYTTVSVYLHIPLVIMLMGVIARGTAFSFRNYDAIKDDMQNVYNRIYVYSSFITPFFLGVIAGSAVSRRIDDLSDNFLSAYVFDWFNLFSVSVGLFTVSLCGFLAAVYLIGEVKDAVIKQRYIRKARITNIAMILCAVFIFASAFSENIPLINWLFGNIISLLTASSALISLIFLWINVDRDKTIAMRFFAGSLVTTLLMAVTYSHYPDIILLKSGLHLSLLKQKGPDTTIKALGIALLTGSVFILPSLVYLIYSFDKKNKSRIF